ncbi:hypothetical protein POUND7_004012, partial [Theobroma cacao]
IVNVPLPDKGARRYPRGDSFQVESDDLIAYGLIPEFIGRLPILVSLSGLNEEQLVEIPDTKIESHSVNAVLVDEEAVGLVDEIGCGAKILYGDNELDRFLAKRTLKDFVVCSPYAPSL